MNKFKICMLGAFAVGKTSLVRRYVHSIFSEKYQTTLGVKIDRKSLSSGEQSVELILWDLAGEDEFMNVRDSYLRGTAAAFLVADGTRAETLDIAFNLKQKLYEVAGEVPVMLLLNKSDLDDQWKIDGPQLERLQDEGWQVMETSAKNNRNVDAAFEALAIQLLGVNRDD